MAEVAPAAAAAPKATKKVSKPKKVGPSVSDLMVKTVALSKERSGVSATAVKKALTAGGYDVDKNKARVKTAIKSLVAKGTLVQIKGIGASGSFKMSKTTADEPAKKAAPKGKKPAAAKKPKAAAVKKVVAAKKSPMAAKKPAAAKKVARSPKKVAKSPKKVAKSPKKVVKKAPAAKKAPVKKAAKPKAKKAAPKK
uniref:H15 domain-containing protein n=1 Tax=Gasterosteus aculeatus aculeatus TaxID=481459 RepID=A0AAQ4PIT9_GASAC|nr:histone H1-like [Gasterosteus aculeatus aculeatus]